MRSLQEICISLVFYQTSRVHLRRTISNYHNHANSKLLLIFEACSREFVKNCVTGINANELLQLLEVFGAFWAQSKLMNCLLLRDHRSFERVVPLMHPLRRIQQQLRVLIARDLQIDSPSLISLIKTFENLEILELRSNTIDSFLIDDYLMSAIFINGSQLLRTLNTLILIGSNERCTVSLISLKIFQRLNCCTLVLKSSNFSNFDKNVLQRRLGLIDKSKTKTIMKLGRIYLLDELLGRIARNEVIFNSYIDHGCFILCREKTAASSFTNENIIII